MGLRSNEGHKQLDISTVTLLTTLFTKSLDPLTAE